MGVGVAHLRCIICKRWSILENDTRYCAGCGRDLDVDCFRDLIEMDKEDAIKYPRLWALPDTFRPSLPKP
jgi:predicted amidophosphoribosyltransferase